MQIREIERADAISKAIIEHQDVSEEDLFWLFVELWAGQAYWEVDAVPAILRVAQEIERKLEAF